MTTIEIFDTIVYPDETELIDAIKIANREVRQKIENFKSELKNIDVSESKFPVFVYISGSPTITPPNSKLQTPSKLSSLVIQKGLNQKYLDKFNPLKKGSESSFIISATKDQLIPPKATLPFSFDETGSSIKVISKVSPTQVSKSITIARIVQLVYL